MVSLRRLLQLSVEAFCPICREQGLPASDVFHTEEACPILGVRR